MMIRKLAALPLVLVLAACGADAAQPGEPTVVTVTATVTESAGVSASPEADPTPTPTPTPEVSPVSKEPVRSVRGAIMKQVGEQGALGREDGGDYVTFTVTKIDNNFVCNGYDEEPENGHFVGVHVEATGDPSMADLDFTTFQLDGWSIVDSEGKLQNADPHSVAGIMCVDDKDELPREVGAGMSISGVVVLDVEPADGFIILNQDGRPGWEWPLGG